MRHRPISALLITACLLSLEPRSFGASPSSSTAEPAQVVLVELFTSEGCSSCPPADDILRQINGKRTSAGQLIVGISEHVTYWNDDGWKDPYSSPIYTERQDAYGNRFGLSSVYTPQMVVDGERQFVGNDSRALIQALIAEEHQEQIDLRILSSVPSEGFLTVRFSVKQVQPRHALEIMAVLTDDADSSSVLRGENKGHTLQHVSVARAMTKVATINTDSEETVRIPVPSSITSAHGVGHHLILFAQGKNLGSVVGVDTVPF